MKKTKICIDCEEVETKEREFVKDRNLCKKCLQARNKYYKRNHKEEYRKKKLREDMPHYSGYEIYC